MSDYVRIKKIEVEFEPQATFDAVRSFIRTVANIFNCEVFVVHKGQKYATSVLAKKWPCKKCQK